MNRFPLTLAFRQYDRNGLAIPNGYVVTREAHDQDDVESHVKELGLLGYEVESAIPTGMLDQE